MPDGLRKSIFAQLVRMLITYLVPYSVSTFSSVRTPKGLKRQNAKE